MLKKKITIDDLAIITKNGFDGMDKRFELVVKKPIEHDEEFAKIEVKTDKRFNQTLAVLDKILVIVQRVDQERVFTFATVQRLQNNIENQQKEIQKIKKVLNIT